MEEERPSQLDTKDNQKDTYLKQAFSLRTLGVLIFISTPLLVLFFSWLGLAILSLSVPVFLACLVTRLPILGMISGVGITVGSVWYAFKANKKDYVGIILVVCLLLIAATVSFFLLVSQEGLARKKSYSAEVKAVLSGVRATAQNYYKNEGNNSYGFTTADCNQSGSVFSGSITRRYLDSIRLRIGDRDLRCFADGEHYAISTPLPQGVGGVGLFCQTRNPTFDGYWCVDSEGHQMQISHELNGVSCVAAQ